MSIKKIVYEIWSGFSIIVSLVVLFVLLTVLIGSLTSMTGLEDYVPMICFPIAAGICIAFLVVFAVKKALARFWQCPTCKKLILKKNKESHSGTCQVSSNLSEINQP